jgi:arylsulfatase A-like enzyme
MNSGRIFMGFPSLGSWLTYGLGSESENLPAYVVMSQPEGTPEGGAPCWSSGFLPAAYQGTLFRAGPNPIVNLASADQAFGRDRQRKSLDLLRSLNEETLDPSDSELSARISSYELAFRMQTEAPDTVDLSQETEETRKLYGIDSPETEEFGRRCLISRRLLERGVRFVQLYSGGGPVAMQWDAHDDVNANHEKMCGLTDKPVAGLLTDLKRRGMLDDTLVIWGGEFGRTPVAQKGSRGRDHNATGFTMWFAGAGVKGGLTLGATDEIGLNTIEGRAHINDIHATILHLMGLDHKRLTYLHSGRDERLTDVGGRVIEDLFV